MITCTINWTTLFHFPKVNSESPKQEMTFQPRPQCLLVFRHIGKQEDPGDELNDVSRSRIENSNSKTN